LVHAFLMNTGKTENHSVADGRVRVKEICGMNEVQTIARKQLKTAKKPKRILYLLAFIFKQEWIFSGYLLERKRTVKHIIVGGVRRMCMVVRKKSTYHIYNDGVDVSSVIHSIQRGIFCWIFENPNVTLRLR